MTDASKSLFSGSGGGTRTPDTRIMIPEVGEENQSLGCKQVPETAHMNQIDSDGGVNEIRVECLLARFWRVTSQDHYANVKKDHDGWGVDIRNNDGDLIQWAGVWGSKREAVESALRTLRRLA